MYQKPSSSILFILTVISLCISLNVSAAGKASVTVSEPVPAPLFTLPVIANGNGEFKLEAWLGSVVYVDFWASWCGPCRLSLPALDRLYQDLAGEGLKVVAVSVDVVEEDSLDFLKRYPVSYPVVIDTEGDVPRQYAVNGMPSGYLIDKQGQVREIHVGFKRGDEVALEASIRHLLRE